VAICSSTDTHVQLIIEAAQAGKHIFCEKPIALDLASVDRALEVVKQNGVKLQVGFNRRFHANFKQVRDLVAAGKVGQPHLVRITSRDSAPPPISYVKVSGGIFLDMTIHDFDMARFLIDSEVEEVYAAGAILNADLRARAQALYGSYTEGDPGWYARISESLYRFGLEKTSKDVIEAFLGRPVSPQALLDDMSRAVAGEN